MGIDTAYAGIHDTNPDFERFRDGSTELDGTKVGVDEEDQNHVSTIVVDTMVGEDGKELTAEEEGELLKKEFEATLDRMSAEEEVEPETPTEPEPVIEEVEEEPEVEDDESSQIIGTPEEIEELEEVASEGLVDGGEDDTEKTDDKLGLGGDLGNYITTYEEYKFDNDIIVNGAQHCKSELKFQTFLLDTNPSDQDQVYYNTLIIYKKYDEYIKRYGKGPD